MFIQKLSAFSTSALFRSLDSEDRSIALGIPGLFPLAVSPERERGCACLFPVFLRSDEALERKGKPPRPDRPAKYHAPSTKHQLRPNILRYAKTERLRKGNTSFEIHQS